MYNQINSAFEPGYNANSAQMSTSSGGVLALAAWAQDRILNCWEVSGKIQIHQMESNKVDRALNLASVHGKIFHIKQRILIVQPNQFCL